MALLLKLVPHGGKPSSILKLEIDPKSHPAWTGGKANINDSEGQVAKFEKRFKGLKIGK